MITILGDSIQKRILIGSVWYTCNLSHRDNIEYLEVSSLGAEKVAKELERNGMVVVAFQKGVPSSTIEIDKSRYHVWNQTYHLNQCENLLEWVKDSKVGEFTNYYDKVCFHTEQGFVAAYRDDINNFWKF
jgi:hypothetical protein